MPVRSAFSHNTQRWIVCLLCSLALALISVKNVSFYVIADIVASTSSNHRIPNGGCPFLYKDSYYWTQKTPFVLPYFFWQDQVLATAVTAMYVGRITAVIPAGMLADLGFSRYVLCGGVSLMVVAYMFLSFFSSSSVALLLESLVEGISEALVYASVFTLIVRWAPSTKRNFYTAVVLSGFCYGEILGQIFYRFTFLKFKSLNVGLFATGLIWLVWLVLGYFFIYQSPVVSVSNPSSIDSPNASSPAAIRRRKTANRVARLRGIPWRQMLCSGPFLSVGLAFCVIDLFISYNFTTYFQVYQGYVLRLPSPFLNIATSIMVVEVPSLLIAGFASDYIIERHLMSKIFFKKSLIFISMFLTTVVQIAATFSGCDVILFWILSIVAIYVIGFAKPLIVTNLIDLAPLHTGLMVGIICSAGTMCCILKEKFDTIIIYGDWNLEKWREKMIIYFIQGFVMIFPYLYCGSGRLQPRSYPSVFSGGQSIVTQSSVEEEETRKKSQQQKN